MKFIGSIDTIGPSVPTILANSLEVKSNCEMTEFEAKLIGYAFLILAKEIESQKADIIKIPRVTAIITSSDTLSFSMEPQTFGEQVSFVFLPIHKWRSARLNNDQIAAIVLEELCHQFFMIVDESAVKHKVWELFKKWVSQDVTYESLYQNFH